MAKTVAVAEMSTADAMEIIRKDEIRKEKKRQSLKKWRTAHKSEYNEYIKTWRKNRAQLVADAKKLLGQ